MMDEEKNRVISESIEPMETLITPHVDECLIDPIYSPTKAWFWLSYYHLGDVPKLEPRAWHTDENASAMLLEGMPEPELWLETRTPRLWGCCADLSSKKEEGVAFGTDRKTAIRDAYYALIAAKSLGTGGQ